MHDTTIVASLWREPALRPAPAARSWSPAAASTLVEIARARARLQPDERGYTYLADKEPTLAFDELDRRARAIATALQRRAPIGERALLPYQPGLDFVAAFFGCLYAGVIAVPVAPPRLGKADHTVARLQAIAENAEPAFLLSTASTLAGLATVADLPPMERIATDQVDPGLAWDWQEPRLDRDTAAYLQYSSGSTGAPKGVLLTHRNVLANLALIQRTFGIDDRSAGVSWLPHYHDMGLVGSILLPVYQGGPIWLMSPISFLQRPFQWLEAISRQGATVSGGPNFAFDLCVRRISEEQRATLDLSRWQVAYTGSEPVRAEVLERFAATFASCGFRREALFPCYGLAEAALMVSGGPQGAGARLGAVDAAALAHNRVAPARPDRPGRELVSGGRTWPELEVAIVDPHTLERCAPEQVGEIWVSGDCVGQGYWRRPDATAAAFGARPAGAGDGSFLRTGDLGFLLDGHLYVTGRIKDLLIVNGENRYPQDIERTAETSHPAIRLGGCACFAVERGDREEVVVAAEVDRHYRREQRARASSAADGPEGGLDLAAIRKAVRQAVAAEHGLQTHAVLLLKPGSLPMTSSGKIQRHAARAAYLDGTLVELER